MGEWHSFDDPPPDGPVWFKHSTGWVAMGLAMGHGVTAVRSPLTAATWRMDDAARFDFRWAPWSDEPPRDLPELPGGYEWSCDHEGPVVLESSAPHARVADWCDVGGLWLAGRVLDDAPALVAAMLAHPGRPEVTRG